MNLHLLGKRGRWHIHQTVDRMYCVPPGKILFDGGVLFSLAFLLTFLAMQKVRAQRLEAILRIRCQYLHFSVQIVQGLFWCVQPKQIS